MKTRWQRSLGLQTAALLFFSALAQAKPAPVPKGWFVNAQGGPYAVHFSVSETAEGDDRDRWFGWVWSEGNQAPQFYPGPTAFSLKETLSDGDAIRFKTAKALDLGFPVLGMGPGHELWLLVTDGSDSAHVSEWEQLLDSVEAAYRQVSGAGRDPHAYRGIGQLGACRVISAPLPESAGATEDWQSHKLDRVAPEGADAISYKGGSGAAKTVRVHRFLRWLEGCESIGKEADLRLFPIFDQSDQYFLEVRNVSIERLGWRHIDPNAWTSGTRTKVDYSGLESTQVELNFNELSGNLCENEKFAKFCQDEATLRQNIYVFGEGGRIPLGPRRELLESCKVVLGRDNCQVNSFAENKGGGPYRKGFIGDWKVSSKPLIQSKLEEGGVRVRWMVHPEAEVRAEKMELFRLGGDPILLLVTPTPIWKKAWVIWGGVVGILALSELVALWRRRRQPKSKESTGGPELSGESGKKQETTRRKFFRVEALPVWWNRVRSLWRKPEEAKGAAETNESKKEGESEQAQPTLDPQPPPLLASEDTDLEDTSARLDGTAEGIAETPIEPVAFQFQDPTITGSAQSPQAQAPPTDSSDIAASGQDASAGQRGARPEEAETVLKEARQVIEKCEQALRDLQAREALLKQESETLDAKLEAQRTQFLIDLPNCMSKELGDQLVNVKDELRQELNLDMSLRDALGKIKDAEILSDQALQKVYEGIKSALVLYEGSIDKTLDAKMETQRTQFLADLPNWVSKELGDQLDMSLRDALGKIKDAEILSDQALQKVYEGIKSALVLYEGSIDKTLDAKMEAQRTQFLADLPNWVSKELGDQLDMSLRDALGKIKDAEILSDQALQKVYEEIKSALVLYEGRIDQKVNKLEQKKGSVLSFLRRTLQRELPDHAEKALKEVREKALGEIREDSQQEISKAVKTHWKPYADFLERTAPMFEDKVRLDQVREVLSLLDGNPNLVTALVKLAERLPFEGYRLFVTPDNLESLEESREWTSKHGRDGYTKIGEDVARLEPGEVRDALVRALDSLGRLGFWIRCLWSAFQPLGSFREIVDRLPEPARQEWLGAFRCLHFFELVDSPVFRRAARWNGDGLLTQAEWEHLDLDSRLRAYLVRPGDQGIVTQAEWDFLESSGLASEKGSLVNRLQSYLIHRGKPGRLGEVCLALQYLVEAYPREHEKLRRSEFERRLRDALTSASLPPDFHSLIHSAAEGAGFIYRPVPYYQARLDDSQFAFIERSVGVIDMVERIGFTIDLPHPYAIMRLDSPFFFAARDDVYYTGRACIARQ